MNTILDNEEKDGEKELEEEAEERQEAPVGPGTRPSILKALKEHESLAPANPGMGRRMEREAAR